MGNEATFEEHVSGLLLVGIGAVLPALRVELAHLPVVDPRVDPILEVKHDFMQGIGLPFGIVWLNPEQNLEDVCKLLIPICLLFKFNDIGLNRVVLVGCGRVLAPVNVVLAH